MERRKLTDELVVKAGELAATGLPMKSIAAALRVDRNTLANWLKAGADGSGGELENRLHGAIQEGRALGEERLVQQLIAAQDTRAATWLLSHAPDWRETWSDAAAERRAVAAEQARFVQALALAKVGPHMERRILLALKAAGSAVEAVEITDVEPGA